MNIPGTEEWNFTDVKFLPIFKEYAKRINLVETINTMTDRKMDLSPGDAVLGMIMDTVSGRTPLYQLEESFDEMDTELLFGKPISLINLTTQISVGYWTSWLRLGPKRYFPKFHKTQLVVLNWIRAITTLIRPSVSVFGAYEDHPDTQLNITYGYSKDKRPDLMQYGGRPSKKAVN